jgi:hypothetical protein
MTNPSRTASIAEAADWDNDAILDELEQEEKANPERPEDDGQESGDSPGEDGVQPAGQPATAPDPDAPPADEETDQPEGGSPPADTPAAATADAGDGTEGAEPEAVPFTFKVDRTEVAVPNAYAVGDMIVIPKEAWERTIRPNLANRQEWVRERGTLTRQIQTLQSSRSEKERQADALVDELTRILTPGNEEELHAFLNDLERQGPILQAKAEARALREELDARRQQEEETEREAEEAPEALSEGLDHWIGALAEGHPDFKGVQFDRADLRESMMRLKDKVFVRAPQDYPENGVKKGDLVVDTDFVFAVMSRDAAVHRKLAQRDAQRRQAEAANQPDRPRKEVPPTVNGKATATAGKGGSDTGEPQDRASWLKSLKEDDLDD